MRVTPANLLRVYAVAAAVLLALDLIYMIYRNHSLEPLRGDLSLASPATYEFHSSGYHFSRYYPGFRLRLNEPAPSFTDWGPAFSHLWGEEAPLVSIRVVDAGGQVVLEERSALTRSEGWIVTYSPGRPEAEVYKFADFTGNMFGSYTVRVDVLRGASSGAPYEPQFFVSTVKEYALLGVVFFFFALVAALAMIGAGLVIVFVLDQRGSESSLEQSRAAL